MHCCIWQPFRQAARTKDEDSTRAPNGERRLIRGSTLPSSPEGRTEPGHRSEAKGIAATNGAKLALLRTEQGRVLRHDKVSEVGFEKADVDHEDQVLQVELFVLEREQMSKSVPGTGSTSETTIKSVIIHDCGVFWVISRIQPPSFQVPPSLC